MVMLLAFGFAAAFDRTHGLAWITPLVGAWAIVAPWLVHGAVDTTTTIVNNAIIGEFCVLLGLAVMAVGLWRARR